MGTLTLSVGPDDIQSAPWEEAHAYLDEQHPSPEDDSFAVGVLLVPAPIEARSIATAIASLRAPSSTAQRGWFHAVRDGRDAQSALADMIGSEIPALEFRAFRWVPTRQQRPGPTNERERHFHVAALALGRAPQVVRGRIHVHVASGPTFDLVEFREWMRTQDDVRLNAMVLEGGKFSRRFPAFEIHEVPGSNPGVQVADLLLWHLRRERSRLKPRKCKDLRSRAKLLDQVAWVSEDSPMEFADLARASPAPVALRPGPRPWNHIEQFAEAVITIERIVHVLGRDEFPPHVSHLRPRVRAAADALDSNHRPTLDMLRELLRAFLLLVDTAPLHDHSNAQRFANLVGVAVGMLDLRSTSAVSCLDLWSELRYLNSSILGWQTSQDQRSPTKDL